MGCMEETPVAGQWGKGMWAHQTQAQLGTTQAQSPNGRKGRGKGVISRHGA